MRNNEESQDNYDEIWAEIAASEAKADAEIKEKWASVKKSLEGLIEPKYFDFAETNESYYSEGIVEIKKFIPTRTNYPNHEHCKIKGDSTVYIKHTDCIESPYGEDESKYEGEEVEYWVWQQTGHLGDDFSGFLLLPLLDGKRFWKVGYSC